MYKLSTEKPASFNSVISWTNTLGLITTPLAITAFAFEFNIPEGIKWNANFCHLPLLYAQHYYHQYSELT